MSKKTRSSSEPPVPSELAYDPFKFFQFLNTDSTVEETSRQPSLLFPHEWTIGNSVKRAPNCPCFQVLDPENLKSCKVCNGTLPTVNILNEMGSLKAELSKTAERMEIATIKADHAQLEAQDYKLNLEKLSKEIALKEQEIATVRKDLDIIGEKLVDELERRGELQHAKDALQEELEELTRSLFEEANSMVSKEARARQEFQDQENAMRKELDATRLQLQMEQGQLRELKLRMENVILENQKLKSKRLSTFARKPVDDSKEPIFDQDELNYFSEFIQISSKTKLNKIHGIKYLSNILEDDVLPCLRFGLNPKIIGKKLVDSILANALFVEEMNAAQISELEQRDENIPLEQMKYNQVSDISPVAEQPKGEPTSDNSAQQSKSVFARLSSAYNSIRSSGLGDGAPGCSACGKTSEKYRYQFKITDVSGDVWYPICLSCRARIVTVCNFYNFIRHLRQGLYSSKKPKDLYIESIKLRRAMFYTRLGLEVPEFNIKSSASIKPNSIFVETGMFADPLLIGKSSSPSPVSAGSGLYTFTESAEEGASTSKDNSSVSPKKES